MPAELLHLIPFQTLDALAQAAPRLKSLDFDARLLRENAERFDMANFKSGIRHPVDELLGPMES